MLVSTSRSAVVSFGFAFALVLSAGPAAADLDVVFVLDTTGSMSGELREVQERVRQLATSLTRARSGERLRYGVVAYRDRGDAYVTKVHDLSPDVDAAESFLSSLSADGGGDGPEAVVAAVAAALREVSWDRHDRVDRQIFLIGDAPPHLDYFGDPTPDDLIAEARRARIVINTVGCRSLPPHGVDFFRTLAYATEGSYQHIGRVAAAGSGELTHALERSAAPAHSVGVGRELGVNWLAHSEWDGADVLVRQSGPDGVVQSRTGDGLEACTLEVRLPNGFALITPPRVWLETERLRVELAVTDGPGGRELYLLSDCPPTTTPIRVSLGGM
jgi:Mg-chelatase subunit ChlD